MVLTKNGQTISLDNENHVEAFLSSGWAEVKSSAPAPASEAQPEVVQPAEEVKVEAKPEKKPVRKKQEK